MNLKNLFKYFLIGIIILNIFTGCNNKPDINKITMNNESQQYNVEKFWNEKIRFLCETGCKDFDNPTNLKKDYILDICQYYKILSNSNIEYDEEIKKYIISEIEIQDIVNNLFGIENFKFENKKYYNQENGLYEFDDYFTFFDDKEYDDKEINKLDDQRLEFKLTVKDSETNIKHIERYILKKDDNNKYYIASKESE